MIQAEVAGKDANFHIASPNSLPLLTQAASQLPSTIQALLAARLMRLSPRARTVASVAAVIGREFSFAVLAHACKEREEDVLQGLDELWQQRIIRDRDAEVTQAYDFSHDKLREQLTASLSPAHRQLLHLRVADACKIVYADEEDSICGQIAAHYEQAGLLAQAIPFYQRAGEIAAHMYAHAEALHAFRRAATLLEKHQPGTKANR